MKEVCERTPLVSVIVPVYNTGKLLERAVDSVLRQSCADLELILVDDGSTDESGAICDRAAQADGRVRVIHQANGGVAAARNAGLGLARGTYVSFLDSDDYLEAEYLQSMLDAIKRDGSDGALCNYVNRKPNGEVVPRYDFDGDQAFEKDEFITLLMRFVVAQAVAVNLLPRAYYEGISFPEGHLFEDVRCSYRLYEKAKRISLVMKPLYNRDVRPDSISHIHSIGNRVDGCIAYIERYEDVVKRRPDLKRAMLVGCCRHSLPLLRKLVIQCPKEEFRKHRGEIARVCAFYREHAGDILPEGASFALRTEFALAVRGSYAGFYLSRIAARLFGGHEGLIAALKLPD